MADVARLSSPLDRIAVNAELGRLAADLGFPLRALAPLSRRLASRGTVRWSSAKALGYRLSRIRRGRRRNAGDCRAYRSSPSRVCPRMCRMVSRRGSVRARRVSRLLSRFFHALGAVSAGPCRLALSRRYELACLQEHRPPDAGKTTTNRRHPNDDVSVKASIPTPECRPLRGECLPRPAS